jgi:hypothetical protein
MLMFIYKLQQSTSEKLLEYYMYIADGCFQLTFVFIMQL